MGAAHLAGHRVEAVIPSVGRHPDGREDVPPPLAGVLQRVLHVVQACTHRAVLGQVLKFRGARVSELCSRRATNRSQPWNR